jgi:flavin reductase (DIM6/NTAB) family NADH-FMN oxidoreductase RutF
MTKRAFPLGKVYTLLEPGPVVLLTTASGGKQDVMAMSWHTMLEFEPPLVGCVVSDRNFSYRLLCASGECAINIPSADMAEKVVRSGNVSGRRIDKFARCGLTRAIAKHVGAPLIAECHASLECRVVDTALVAKYCFFVLEVVKAWKDSSVRQPRTLHHRGHGSFMVAGDVIRLASNAK